MNSKASLVARARRRRPHRLDRARDLRVRQRSHVLDDNPVPAKRLIEHVAGGVVRPKSHRHRPLHHRPDPLGAPVGRSRACRARSAPEPPECRLSLSRRPADGRAPETHGRAGCRSSPSDACRLRQPGRFCSRTRSAASARTWACPGPCAARRAPRPLARTPETGPIRRDRRRRPDPEGNGPSRDDPRELGRGARRLRRRRSGPPRDRPDRAGDPWHGRRGDRQAWRPPRLPRADGRAEGPAPFRAPRNGDRRVHDMALEPASGGADLDRRSAGVGGVPRVHIDIGVHVHENAASMCALADSACRWTALRLHHGRRTGDAVPEGAAVAGATPLFRCLVRHRGGLDVHAHPPSVGRSLPSSNAVGEGHRSPWDGRVPDLAAWAVARAIGGTPAFLGDARLPDGRPVGERVTRRLEAALKPPSRVGIDGSGATPRDGGRGVKTRLRPNPYQALGLGGRSPPRPCCPVRHRRPGGERTQLQATARDR